MYQSIPSVPRQPRAKAFCSRYGISLQFCIVSSLRMRMRRKIVILVVLWLSGSVLLLSLVMADLS